MKSFELPKAKPKPETNSVPQWQKKAAAAACQLIIVTNDLKYKQTNQDTLELNLQQHHKGLNTSVLKTPNI